MSGETNRTFSPELLLSQKIKIDLLPEKKGFLKKHAEYLVTSEVLGTQVCRRYSDFMALNEQLRSRFPYRMVPRLPPQALTALVAGTDSDFAESRRKALKRWLTIIATHPILSNDLIVKFFLTFTGDDAATRIREEFRTIPDEFIDKEDFIFVAKENQKNSLDLKKEIESNRAQIVNFSNIVGKLVGVATQTVERANKASHDMNELAKDLDSLPPLPSLGDAVIGPKGWGPLQKSSHELKQGFAHLSDQFTDEAKTGSDLVVETAKILQDILSGYSEVCDHVFSDKQVNYDHKKSGEKMSNIKRKIKLQGSLLGHDLNEYDRLEKHLEKNHFELSDFDNRRAFAYIALTQETKLVLIACEIFGISLLQLIETQKTGNETKLEIFKKLFEAGKYFKIKN